MEILLKSSGGVTTVPADAKLFMKRKVFLEGEITQEKAVDFIKKIILLTEENPEAGIDLLINSPGGDVNSGMLCYDAIQASVAPIRLLCVGRAYSMAALLFASGKHGRLILPHGELMLHEPLLGNQVSGSSSSSIKSISESLLETKDMLDEILALHTHKTKDEISAMTSYDHYFKAQECVAEGLADKIVGFDEILREDCRC